MRNWLAVFLLGIILMMFLACRDNEEPVSRDKNDFLAGGDISMLTKIEELGGVFREKGKRHDFFDILKSYNCNCFRLRLFVNPNYENAVINDLPYTVALGKRIKKAGMKLLLNFHYSDTWADPGKQYKPAAWRDLDFDSLVTRVESYTKSVIIEFKNAGALPDIVQIGNEVTPGMLWPEGKVGGEEDTERQWERFTQLLKAGIRGVRATLGQRDAIRIMIHIDRGGDWPATQWFFDNLNNHNVPFDMIGLSYYPSWHGSMDDVRNTLHETAMKYQKDILLVETAYPFRGEKWWKDYRENMVWPISPEGQHDFLVDLVNTVRQTPEGRGIGVIWWYPESVPVKGLRVWNGGATAWFDSLGNVLPVVKAFQQ